MKRKRKTQVRRDSHSGRVRRIFSSNALAPFGVASIFRKSTTSPIRREPYTMDRLQPVERQAKPLRNNWLDPFRSVCADRKERRSVLFATKKVGKGKAIHTPKTYSIRSSVKCKG
jgi:hypothetical protein